MSISVPVFGDVKTIHANVTIPGSVNASASVSKPLAASTTIGATLARWDVYDGEYESTPRRDSQLYETDGKIMESDFTVLGIPVHESPNEFGTTFTIGA